MKLVNARKVRRLGFDARHVGAREAFGVRVKVVTKGGRFITAFAESGLSSKYYQFMKPFYALPTWKKSAIMGSAAISGGGAGYTVYVLSLTS
ncbi:MAG: hypothetical protein ABFS86_13470 [Planctomycetota bacterium]